MWASEISSRIGQGTEIKDRETVIEGLDIRDRDCKGDSRSELYKTVDEL